jgi:hypothetical protein
MIKEKRQARRQPLRYTAWVAVTAEQRLGCVVSDISDTGARIDVQDSATIPDHFVLLLSSNGAARRFCRVVWRKPTQMGVKFERSLADAANATLAPKADADADVPAPDAAAAPAIVDRPKPNDRLGRGRRCAPTIFFYNQVC